MLSTNSIYIYKEEKDQFNLEKSTQYEPQREKPEDIQN